VGRQWQGDVLLLGIGCRCGEKWDFSQLLKTSAAYLTRMESGILYCILQKRSNGKRLKFVLREECVTVADWPNDSDVTADGSGEVSDQ